MTELVLDASVVIKWWHTEGEDHLDEAQALQASFEAGELLAVAPSLLQIEIVNAFARRWTWPEEGLLALARALKAARFELENPDLESVARWTARGLTAYDASYVALAESRGIELVTDDESIVARAGGIARSLAS